MHILQLCTSSKVLKGQFVQQTRASLAGDHFLYTCGITVYFRDDIVRRNWKLLMHRGQRDYQKNEKKNRKVKKTRKEERPHPYRNSECTSN